MSPAPTGGAGDTDRLRLARAVAVPGSTAILVRPDNNSSATPVDLDAAVSLGTAYAVVPRDDLLALDFDTPDDDERGRRYRALVDLLGRHGVPTVEVASGGEGRRHLFAVVGRGEAAGLLAGRCRRVFGGDAVRTGNLRIRPPLSPHRLGRPVQLLSPIGARAAADVLEGAPASDEQVAAVAAEWAPQVVAEPRVPTPRSEGLRGLSVDQQLAQKHVDLLLHGAPKGRRSDAIWSVAFAAANYGWSAARFAETILASPLGEKPREKSDPKAWLERQYAKARERVAADPAGESPTDRAARIDQHRNAATCADLTPMQQRVLEGYRQIAEDSPLAEFGASTRQVMVAAGVGRGSAGRATGSLVKAGWLERVSVGGQGVAARFLLAVPRAARGDTGGTVDRTPPRTGSTVPWLSLGALIAHDAWSRGALRAAQPTFCLLDAVEPRPARELAARQEVNVRTVWRHLAALEGHQLAVRDADGGWTAATQDPARLERLLDDAAQALGVAGHGEDRQEKVAAEQTADRRQLVLKALTAGPLTFEDLAARTRLPTESVEGGLRGAVAYGQAHQLADGRWSQGQPPPGVDPATGERTC